MYRKDPKAFKKHSHKHGSKPDSQVLGAWYERLHFKETANAEKVVVSKGFLFMGMLAILAGISTRIIFYFVEQEVIAQLT